MRRHYPPVVFSRRLHEHGGELYLPGMGLSAGSLKAACLFPRVRCGRCSFLPCRSSRPVRFVPFSVPCVCRGESHHSSRCVPFPRKRCDFQFLGSILVVKQFTCGVQSSEFIFINLHHCPFLLRLKGPCLPLIASAWEGGGMGCVVLRSVGPCVAAGLYLA